VDNIKTIFDLRLLEGGAEFDKGLRGMDDEFWFSIPLFGHKTKGICAQQDQ
jgi:hypothetical protein